MAGDLAKIFWGLILVAFHIQINHVDLLPDGFGYLLMAWGCGGLVSASSKFATSGILCYVAAVLWLIDFVVDINSSWSGQLFTTALECVMIWNLLGGVAELTLAQDRRDLADRAMNRRMVYVVLNVIVVCLRISDGDWVSGVFGIAVGIGSVVLTIMILHLLYKTQVQATALAFR